MTLEEYLSSPQAVEDVCEVGRGGVNYLSVDVGGVRFGCWLTSESGVWMRWQLRWTVDGEVVSRNVYFRRDSDRYLVSDLGEAAHALRLRTGLCALTLTDVYVIEGLARGLAVSDAMIFVRPTAEELPTAIVHVLAAAHRVATMEPF